MADDKLKKDSILLSIKHRLGIDEIDYFDSDIIMDINTVLSELTQLGIGPKEGFMIENEQQTWKDILGSHKNLEMVKTLVYLKVKLIFDPPTSGILTENINKQISELVWRIYVARDNEMGGNT